MSSTAPGASATQIGEERRQSPVRALAGARPYARIGASKSLDVPPMSQERPARERIQDRAQFEATLKPHLPRLYRFCLALSGAEDRADDLFQNTLIKAYLNFSSFEGRSDLVVWLCGIARHEHLEARRTEARRRGIFERFVDACAAALGLEENEEKHPSPETYAIEGEHAGLLMQCLQKLPEDFRAVVVLCDIEELGYDRAAEILGIPKGTVKSRHARGRVRLREVFEAATLTRNAEPVEEEST